jgi:hypothetical protein
MENFLEKIYEKSSQLKRDDKYKECLNCECYFGLLYYFKEELLKIENFFNKDILDDIIFSVENRKKAKTHKCLGCDPCPPAEWTVELLRKCKSS